MSKETPIIAIAPLRDAFSEYTRSYTNMASDYSITDLINPPQVIQLRRRYQAELDKIPMTSEDILSGLASFKGTGVHNQFRNMLYRYINRHPNVNYMIERRLWDRIRDRKISGQFDAFLNGALYDFKNTSVWKRIFGQLTDFESQLNLYAYLLWTCGVDVSILYVIALYSDWDKYKINQDNYPKLPIEQIRLNLWTPEKQRDFMFERIDLHKANEEKADKDLQACSADDMWAKSSTYAVVAPGGKRAIATKGLTTRKKAEDYIKNSKNKKKDTWMVDTRPGERTRCENWCRFNGHCYQHQCYLKEQEAA